MIDFLRRRKRLIASTAIGVAGAAAVYYWWRSPEPAACVQGGTSWPLQDEPAQARARGKASKQLSNVSEASNEIESALEEEEEEEQEQVEATEGCGLIDASMNALFASIQGTFVPTETQQLLDKLQGKLAEMTDIASHIQQLRPTADAQEKLGMVLRLCLTHAFGSVWLVSVVQLLTRVKLNIIGRHMFLQEKLSKLAQPPPPPPLLPFSLLPQDLQQQQQQQQALPPQLDPRAVQAFLACDSFATHGFQWLLLKVMNGAEIMLREVSVTKEMDPPELLHFMGSMLVSINRCIGPTVNWADVLVGTDAMTQASKLHLDATTLGLETHQAIQASTTVEELHVELRDVLCSRNFSGALRASVQHSFKGFAMHLTSSLTPNAPTNHPRPAAAPTNFQHGSPGVGVCQSQHANSQSIENHSARCIGAQGDGDAGLGPAGASSGVVQYGHSQVQPSPAAIRMMGLSPSGVSQIASAEHQQGQQPQVHSWHEQQGQQQAGQHTQQQQQQLSRNSVSCPVVVPKVPLVRSAKQVRAAADALLSNLGPLNQEFSSLKPIMALSASVFGTPSGVFKP